MDTITLVLWKLCYIYYVFLPSDNLVACSLLLSNGADPKAKENDGLIGLVS